MQVGLPGALLPRRGRAEQHLGRGQAGQPLHLPHHGEGGHRLLNHGGQLQGALVVLLLARIGSWR